MFTEDDVINTFPDNIEANMLIVGNIGVFLDVFVERFGDVNLDKESLINHENTTPYWKDFFENLFAIN